SPPVALHPASQRRSYSRLQAVALYLERTCTSLYEYAHGRTTLDRRSGPKGNIFKSCPICPGKGQHSSAHGSTVGRFCVNLALVP
ncbi:MAG: hypothetical protein ACLQMS_11470, partial [Desulfomonilaceae bacterium]